MPHRNIYIGIDPAFRQNGFAMCIIDEDNTVNFIIFKNGFRDFQKWLFQDAPACAFVAVENSNLQDTTFDMRGTKQTIAKVSRSVGKNQAISQCVVDACNEKEGFTVFDISPAEKGKKIVNLQYFDAIMEQEKHKEVHGYSGNKNEQDKRDAYMLALIAKKKAKISRHV